MLSWTTTQEWADHVKRGTIQIRPGDRLTFEQMAALGSQPPTGSFACGAPGSRASQDATTATRKLQAAAARHRSQELAAASAGARPDPVASMARKLEASFQRSGVFPALEAQMDAAILNNATRDTTHRIAAGLHHQERTIGKDFSKKVRHIFSDDTAPATPGRGTRKDALAELTSRVNALIQTIETYLRHRSATVTGARRRTA